MAHSISCPLCESSKHSAFHQDNNKRSKRLYLQCLECHLVFVPSEFYLTSEQEKAEYDQHENSLDDKGYETFLNRFWQPVQTVFQHQKVKTVLEFGCGPGPLLGNMMQKAGYHVSLYDVFYANYKKVLQVSGFDAITATEVILGTYL